MVSIPDEIARAYFQHGIKLADQIPGGEINVTFLVIDRQDEKSILQRLSKIYDTRLAPDYEAVSSYLNGRGWEIPRSRLSSTGDAYVTDSEGWLWRSFSYLESSPGRLKEGDIAAAVELSALLGRLHSDLAEFDYLPQFCSTHPPTSDYHARRLSEVKDEIPDSKAQELAGKTLTDFGTLSISEQPTQLIHGDTRIGNSLFRADRPFTFIDWDGIKVASPLIDVGDMLQSTIGEVLTVKNTRTSHTEMDMIIDAYYLSAQLKEERLLFKERCYEAAQMIALLLGMRHLVDTVEDRYFTHNPELFASRRDFNLFCARRQWRVYETLGSR